MSKNWPKVNRAVGAVETTAAIALLLAISFYVGIQDSISLMQASRDARNAAALLWVENEVALSRSSLAPWATNTDGTTPHLALYPTSTGVTNTTQSRLIGAASAEVLSDPNSTANNTYFSNFKGTVNRSVTSVSGGLTGGYGGSTFVTYCVEVSIPYKLKINSTKTNVETISRTFSRVFSQ